MENGFIHIWKMGSLQEKVWEEEGGRFCVGVKGMEDCWGVT